MSIAGLCVTAMMALSSSILSSVSSTSVTLTSDSPTSNIASVSLIDSTSNSIGGDKSFRCVQGRYDSFCVELDVFNSGCNGIETLEISVYGGRVSGDVDLHAIFSVLNSDDLTVDYLSFFSDWDGGMKITSTYPNAGGVYTSPICGTNLLNKYTDNTDIIGTLFNSVNDAWGTRAPFAANDNNNNWYLMSNERIGLGTQSSPITYSIINNIPLQRIITKFNTDSITQVTCQYDTTFDTLNSGNNYKIGFQTDQGTVKFDKFDVSLTCQPGCDYSHTCTARGDPHITTFDGLYYHFQGNGYFDYIKDCGDDNVLPFIISAKQTKCRPIATCIGEVIVTLNDNSNTQIIFARTGGTPTKNVNGIIEDISGTFEFTDNNNEIVSYTVANGFFEISFVYNNNLVKLKLEYSGWSLSISTSECLFGDTLLCGLCGNINNNKNNDFQRCDNLELVDQTGVDTGRLSGLSGKAWDNTHLFGESCCNQDLDIKYIGDTDCNLDAPVPTEIGKTCVELAQDLCIETWNTFDTTGTDATNEWLDGCGFDVCADTVCKQKVENGGYTFFQAITDGSNCLNTVIGLL